MTTSIVVRLVAEPDRDAWSVIFRAYRDFYGKTHDSTIIDTVWKWIIDPEHSTRCLIAEDEGRVIGLGHFRTFARPIVGGHGLYLDDLFTVPSARGTGAASAILQRLVGIAHDEDATVVRWITAESNETARRLYDQVATQTHWITYDLSPQSK
ncbi:GNAT family N-acetyltransferase [Nesterenkonia sp. LB17]|uniref:GNAT family N-acetyltransferase n=1 Tax=Nesterenkonia sp. LB17 TaxID=2901230 RepID=UPI001F4CCE7D|nr:GNAT family N-acetyltransferase [Nesterenkonia sp. LB17]MCH8565274.1 GNAT family N-acetyltransferase [Nesterenkonia sp. LB17]